MPRVANDQMHRSLALIDEPRYQQTPRKAEIEVSVAAIRLSERPNDLFTFLEKPKWNSPDAPRTI
jgi:hypothetical protein